MDTFARDLRYAVRTLLRMRGVAVVAILTLALGIGATTTMFSVVYAMLLRPPPFADPDRLVILFNTSVTPRDGLQRLRWSMPNITELERVGDVVRQRRVVHGTAVHDERPRRSGARRRRNGVARLFSGAARAARSPAGSSRADEELGVGRAACGADQRAAVEAEARRAIPPSSAARSSVNDVPLTIIGILPDGFAGLSGKAELWIPPPMAARLYYSEYLTTPQNFISVVARLKDGVSLQQANAELAAIGPRFIGNGSAPDTVWGATAVPLREARVDPIAAAVRARAAGGGGVRAAHRLRQRRQPAARARARAAARDRGPAGHRLGPAPAGAAAAHRGTGDGRGRRRRAAPLLAWWGVGVFARTAPAVIASGRNNYARARQPRRAGARSGVLLFALAVALGTTLLFALVPALAASRAELVTALKEDDRGGGRGGRALSILVVTEVAIACLLLTASGLLIESFARIQSRRTGFVSDDVLTFWVRPPGSRYPPASGPATVDRLLTRIQAVPGVESAAVNRCMPFSGCSRHDRCSFPIARSIARTRRASAGTTFRPTTSARSASRSSPDGR